MAPTRRFRGISRALAAAVLVVGLGAGPLAGAATSVKLDSFSGKGSGYALGVSVDLSGLPDAVKAPIGSAYTALRGALPDQLKQALPADWNFIIDQRFIETLAEIGVAQKAQSYLSHGTIDLGKLLGGSDVASVNTSGTSHVVTKTLKLPTDDLPIVDVAAGILDASALTGPNVSSTGTLAKVGASLQALGALMPTELQTAFGDLRSAVNDVINTANSSLDTEIDNVATTITQTTDPVLGGLLTQAGLGSVADDAAQLSTTLKSLLQIPTVGDLLSGDIAAITALKNTANSQKLTSGKIVSDATSNLANINVLGLLNVDAVKLMSHSEAAGVPGSAKNTSDCKIADVKLGGANGVSLDGKTLYVNGVALPTPAGNISQILSTINDVTNVLGLSVTLCDATQSEADANGTAAAQRVSAIRVVLAPKAPADIPALGIKAGQALVKIVIDPTVETAVAAHVATSVKPNLPKTGSGPVIPIAVGLGLAGTAIFLRRKFA